MFNKSTMQCAVVVEKFHKSSSERIQILGSHPSQDTSRAGIQGLDQKLPYLVSCPPVITKMCKNPRFLLVVRVTFFRHFLALKCKLPNPQESALRCPNLTPFVEAKGIILHISQQAGVHILTPALK